MKLQLKDVVFAAIIAAAMNVISFIAVPLVMAIPLPGAKTVAVAPFYGLFLAIALLKTQKYGVLTLVSFLAGIPMFFISPCILAFLVASGLSTDLCLYLFFHNLRKDSTIILASGIFMAFMVPYGLLFGALLAGGTNLATFLLQPWLVLGATLICFFLGGLGGKIGMKIGKEFQTTSLMK